MARIDIEDLTHLTNDEIRQCYLAENIDELPNILNKYKTNNKSHVLLLNRIIHLLNVSIVDKFLNKTIN